MASIFVAMHERSDDFWAIFGRKLREIRSKDTKDATTVRLRELYPNEMVVRLFRNRDTLRDFKRDEYIRNRSTINFKRSRKS